MGWNHWSELGPDELPAGAGPSGEAWEALVKACRFVEDAIAIGGTVAFAGAAGPLAARDARAPFLGTLAATSLRDAPATPDRVTRLEHLSESWDVSPWLDTAKEAANRRPEARSHLLGEQPDVIIALGDAPDIAAVQDFGIPVVATTQASAHGAVVDFELLGDADDTELVDFYALALNSAVAAARRSFYEGIDGSQGWFSYQDQLAGFVQEAGVSLHQRLASLETVDAGEVLSGWDDGSDVAVDLA